MKKYPKRVVARNIDNPDLTEEASMADRPIPLNPVPPDADDFESLWIDPGLGDGIVTASYNNVPVDKPKAFFRTHPSPDFRRRTEIYTHKPEGAIDEQHFIIAPSMRGFIEEARRCTLVCVVYRDGSPRLWNIKFPREGEKDNQAWVDSRSAAKAAIDRWLRIVWVGRIYQIRYAQPGYAPDPDWTKLPSWEELIRLAFGEHGIIRDKSHPIYRELIGAGTEKPPRDEVSGKDF
jgi:hypothetical protein